MNWRKLSGIEWMFLGVVAICAASIGLLWTVTLDQSHDGAIAKQALCTLKLDLKQRVNASRQFLAEHPDGIAGISAATIQSSIDNQQRTIDSLANLNCLEGAP